MNDQPTPSDRLTEFAESFSPVWNQSVYGNPVQQWLVAIAVTFVSLFLLRIVAGVLAGRAGKFAERLSKEWATLAADLSQRIKFWFLLTISLYFGSLVLALPDKVTTIIQSIAVIALLLQAAIWGNALLTFAVSRYVSRKMESDAASVTTISAIGFLCRLALWAIVLLLALDNLGIDVTALVAGLGIGGIAVALAAQNVLGDLFASLSIVMDKPFVLGDFIIIDDKMGTVEKIGLKTTRLRSLSGEQLIFANNDLLQSRIQNFKRMQERRIVFTIGVTYETPYEKLVAIPEMIRQIIEAQDHVRFDRAHFKGFGDFSLNFEMVYHVLTRQYNTYMDIQQAINLAIYERFERAGIDFAYPTQTVHLPQTLRRSRVAGRDAPNTENVNRNENP